MGKWIGKNLKIKISYSSGTDARCHYSWNSCCNLQSGRTGLITRWRVTARKTIELIQKTKTLTQSPFVNLFTNLLPKKPDKLLFDTMQNFLKKICIKTNFGYERLSFDSLNFHSYIDQIDCVSNERIPIVSFTFGMPDSNSIKAFKQQGAFLIGTATCLKKAEILDHIWINIITAQGLEAGGIEEHS